ncbi:MAG: ThiF family adenylyltransferase [Pseudomonadota bacterium]
MSNQQWLDEVVSIVIAADELGIPNARFFARLVGSEDYDGGSVQECRRSGDGNAEAIVVDVQVDLGQAEIKNDIKLTESVAFVFFEGNRSPFVIPLRENFPLHLPHVNSAPEGEARTLCLFEASIDELERLYTPHRYIERLRWWLKETAYGRLHGDDQPLEPFFMAAPISLVMPLGFRENDDQFLAGVRQGDADNAPVVFYSLSEEEVAEEEKFHSAIVINTDAVEHGTLRWLPSNLCQLFSAYKEVGIDLAPLLAEKLRVWAGDNSQKDRLRRPAVLVISTPLLSAQGRVRGRSDKAFFLGGNNWLNIGVLLGTVIEAAGEIGPRLLGQADPDLIELENVRVMPCDVYERASRESLQEISGREPGDTQSVLLIGAGALGSQVALMCAQGGIGKWHVIDPDHLLPHNTARHRYTGYAVGNAKADAVASEIRFQLGDDEANAYVMNFADFEASNDFVEVVGTIDVTIDASASIQVARKLAGSDKINSRCVSMFLNPLGTSLVVLAEGEERTPRLDFLEMSYYWKLVCEESLWEHLTGRDNTLPIGTCRSPSVRISQTFMGMFAAIAGEFIAADQLQEGGTINIWSSEGQIDKVTKQSWSGEAFKECTIGSWSVAIRDEVLSDIKSQRASAGELETGGILVGCWDLSENKLYIVGHFDAPPDSVHEPTGFIRGSVGVFHSIEHVENVTATNLTYIGEWHTHPPGDSSSPSSDDAKLLRWIEKAVSWNGVPAVMMIAAEDGVRVIIEDEETRQEHVIANDA